MLLRDQATSLQQTVAAAARSNFEAERQAEAELASRMLENARMVGALDRRGLLDESLLDEIVQRHGFFRASVFDPDGNLVFGTASRGRPRRGRGPAFGGNLLDQLLSGEEIEAATDIHASRWGEVRLAAGVRRAEGGAIILNVDATAVENLRRQASLDALLADITESAREVAFIIFEQNGLHIAHGQVPPSPPADVAEREIEVDGASVLELSGPIVLDDTTSASLRLGMRLGGVQRAEQRMMWQIALSLAASLALGVLGVGMAWLSRKYSLLSLQHARTEEALRRRDRLAAMGELSSTVAHEVRNPLNAIAMSAKRLRQEFLDRSPESPEDREEVDELLGVLEGQTQRINQTVQQFLDFARPPKLSLAPAHLGEIVTDVADGARVTGKARGITVDADVSGARQATVDSHQFHQALDNIVRNAIEATPEGGRVVLTAKSGQDGHTIVISDTGCGIDAEDLPRLFDLYFTTKAEGTGVGLAVTQQIIVAHGGTIEVDSHPGEGTRMSVKLPKSAEDANRE